MKKIIITCLLLFAFSTTAIAEPYKDSRFPPEQLVLNSLNKNIRNNLTYLGKFKIKDGMKLMD